MGFRYRSSIYLVAIFFVSVFPWFDMAFTETIAPSSRSDALGGPRGEVTTKEWTPITNLNEPRVVHIGKFAVTEHNKEAKTRLVFKKILKGEIRSTSVGHFTTFIYRLVISTKQHEKGHGVKDFEVVVSVTSDHSKTLISFVKNAMPIDSPPPLPHYHRHHG